ncbi:MAG: hypothetical protein IIW81_02620, partial [Oscillospiraceae bacterium]|nr:hypothetical protein [Oscillospiraceae bacterium]
DSMIRLMKGPSGTKVKITVSREGTTIPFDIISLKDAEKRGIKKLWLGASKDGRPLYEKLGFIRQESYMELTLKDQSEV